MSAPKRNRNAAKPPAERATDWLHLRVHVDDKRRWLAAAQAQGLRLSQWVVASLNAAS